jgi:transposase InsO family protein
LYNRCGARKDKPRQVKKKLGRKSRVATSTGLLTGTNMRPEWVDKIMAGGRLYHERREKPSWKKAYEETLKRYFYKDKRRNERGEIDYVLPDWNLGEIFTQGQFRYHYLKHRDEGRALLRRAGKRAFTLLHRRLKGPMRADGPGQIYLVDATLADVYLISRFGGRVLLVGRPVVWVLIDVYSRMIVGLAVRFEHEGWMGLKLALVNTTSDKVTFCKKYGLHIAEEEWPAKYLCEEIGGDRGPLISEKMNSFISDLNVEVSNTPPYRPDWKGVVERLFKSLNIMVFNWLPGGVVPRSRGEEDYRLHATLTIEELTAALIDAVLVHNNEQLVPEGYEIDPDFFTTGKAPTPLEIYRWGCDNKGGHLRERDPERIRINLLEQARAAAATGQGIEFKHPGQLGGKPLLYDCPDPRFKGAFLRNNEAKRLKPTVFYDQGYADEIYVRFRPGEEMIACPLKDSHSIYRGRDWAEVIDYATARQVQRDILEPAAAQSRVNYQARLEGRVRKARRRNREVTADAPPPAKGEFVGGQRANRRHQVVRMQAQDAEELRAGAARPAPPALQAAQAAAPGGGSPPRDDSYVGVPVVDIAEIRRRRMGR